MAAQPHHLPAEHLNASVRHQQLGELVGSAVVSGVATAFSYSGGTYTAIAPDNPSYGSAINNAGVIAGSYYTGSLYKIFINDGTTLYSGISPSDNDSSNSNPSNEFAVELHQQFGPGLRLLQ